MIKKINVNGLCEKCNKIVKPYFIYNKKCYCQKHLKSKLKGKELKEFGLWEKINTIKKLKKQELKILKEIKAIG